MNLSFEDDALEQRCACEETSVNTWGGDDARVIRRRLAQLVAAESVAHVRLLPFCELTNLENGCYCLNSANRLRITFEGVHGKPRSASNRDEREVQDIRILTIEITDAE
jgi:hypothetical protein